MVSCSCEQGGGAGRYLCSLGYERTLRLVCSLRSRQNPKNPCLSFLRRGFWGSRKKMERIFWFCFAASSSEMSHFYFITDVDMLSLISPSSRRDEALSYLRFVVTLNPVTSTTASGNFLSGLRQGTIRSYCACPTRPVRAQIPAVGRRGNGGDSLRLNSPNSHTLLWSSKLNFQWEDYQNQTGKRHLQSVLF